MSSERAIRVRNVTKEYELGLSGRTETFASIVGTRLKHPIRGSGRKRERFYALKDVSFDIDAGEVVGVIGRNGAGKSTLLKVLSRITPPTRGYVEMRGTVGSLLEVGTGFHPELTGIENVYLNGTILGMSKKQVDARLEAITDFAEVDQFLSTPVKRYSSGMRVRLAFAVASHLDPEVMIIDEVLSVGDYAFQAKCLEKMRAVAADEGRTVLYVTHNLVNLEHLCPRSLLMVNGHMTFDGPTAETLTHYVHMQPRGQRGSVPGVYELGSRERAAGAPDEVFTTLELRPGGGSPADVVRMGESLHLEIGVQGLDVIPEANVHVTIGSSSVQCLFRMTCRMIPMRAAQGRRPQETIVLEIPSLLLVPGEYFLALGIHDKRANLVDEVPRAAEFTVTAADVLGNGYEFAARDGFIHVGWDWEVRPSRPLHAVEDRSPEVVDVR